MAAPVGMILAAGFATRLKPLSDIRPKVLMEVRALSILHHQVLALAKAGIKDIFINAHYHQDQIKNALKEFKSEISLHLCVEEEILGTGGGIRQMIKKFGLGQEKLVLVHGDILGDVNFKTLIKKDEYVVLLGAQGRSLKGYEGSFCADSQGNILELGTYFSKPGIIAHKGFFTGIHVLSGQAQRDLIEEDGFSLVSDIYPRWLKKGRELKAFMADLAYEDLGTPLALFNSNMAIFDKTPPSFLSPCHEIIIDKSAFIDPNARVTGPVLINAGVVVDAKASIGPYAILGDNVHVKNGALVFRSVVMSHTTIEKDEQLDCVIALKGARVLVK